MSALTDIIKDMNFWNKLTNKPLIPNWDIKNLSAAHVKEILDKIDCDFSPENLCCDGEISAAEANRRGRKLNKARNELMKNI